MFLALWFLGFLISVDTHCPYQDLSNANALLQKTRYHGCYLQESSHGAGPARNVQARCKQANELNGSFFYNISWSHPEATATPVTGYRVYIIYETREHACFQVPSSDSYFVFNKSMGLVYGCLFYFSVTPQPISLVDDQTQAFMSYAPACPVEVKLLPLPNIRVPPESTFSFVASFEAQPIPEAKVVWYFSPDKTSCLKREKLKQSKHDVQLLRNNKVLRILNVKRHHIGCYVVTADNGVGSIQEQRGYLDLNITAAMQPNEQNHFKEFERGIFATIAVVLLVLLLTVFVLILRRRRRRLPSPESEKMLKQNSVYISHCMQKESDRALLLQLVSAIKSYGIDVIIDICSIVDVNNDGGITRWIPTKLKTADKILIVINPDYLIKLKSFYHDTENHISDADNQRVEFEFNLMRGIIEEDMKHTKNVLAICHGVKSTDLPEKFPLKNHQTIPFPDSFDSRCSLNFSSIMKVLLERCITK